MGKTIVMISKGNDSSSEVPLAYIAHYPYVVRMYVPLRWQEWIQAAPLKPTRKLAPHQPDLEVELTRFTILD